MSGYGRNRDGWIILALSCLTVAVFMPVAWCGWLNFDDDLYVTDNAMVTQGLTAKGLRWALTTGHAANWHPLTWLSLMLDAQCFGMNATGFHLTNLAFHVGNVALAYLILARLTGSRWRSALVAAVWAIHPLRVESVAWVAERKDVLSMCFGLGAIFAYIGYTHRGGVKRYLLVMVLMALSLLAKPMFVVLPVLLLVLDYWPLRRMDQHRTSTSPELHVTPPANSALVFLHRLIEKLPLFALSLASSIVTIIVQRQGGAMVSLMHESIASRVANAVVSCVRYMGMMFWFTDLIPYYSRPLTGWRIEYVVAACWVLVVTTIMCIAWRRSRPWLIVGWLWFLVALVPVIGLVQVGLQSIADRYTYLSTFGLLMMLVWSIPDRLSQSKVARWLGAGLAVAVLGILSVFTVRQIGFWRDSQMLWQHTIGVEPDNRVAHSNLASLHLQAGRIDRAIMHSARAMQADPSLNDPIVYLNLGVSLGKKGNWPKAIEYLRMALRADPGMVLGHVHLGNALAAIGKHDLAMESYQTAIKLDPRSAAARTELAQMLAQQGKFDDAEAEFRCAIAANPRYAPAHQALGVFLAQRGRIPQAVESLRMAVALDQDSGPGSAPGSAGAHNNLGVVLDRAGDGAAAVASFQHAAKLQPDWATPYNNLGNTWLRMGRNKEAASAFREAIARDADLGSARLGLARAMTGMDQLHEALKVCQQAQADGTPIRGMTHQRAIILQRMGRTPEALEACQDAAREEPMDATVHITWGQALRQAGDVASAETHLRQAIRLAPNDPTAYLALAQLIEAGPAPVQAIEHYQSALRLAPDDADALAGLGRLLARLGRFEDAATYLVRAAALRPKDAGLAHSTGLALARAGQFAPALVHLGAAVTAQPDNAAFHLTLGQALLGNRQLAEAIEQLRMAVQIQPNSYDARMQLGIALTLTSEPTAAEPQFRAALAIRPDSAEAQARLARLINAAPTATAPSTRPLR